LYGTKQFWTIPYIWDRSFLSPKKISTFDISQIKIAAELRLPNNLKLLNKYRSLGTRGRGSLIRSTPITLAVLPTENSGDIMEDRDATAREPGIEAGTSTQGSERVVSILDFDASGMVTCLVTRPVVNGLVSVRDSRSTRLITMDEWNDISRS
jgi:hypothetical protein